MTEKDIQNLLNDFLKLASHAELCLNDPEDRATLAENLTVFLLTWPLIDLTPEEELLQ